MGWGWIPSSREQSSDQPHVDNPPDDFSAQDFWRWVKEATNWNIFSGTANPLANSRAIAARSPWQSAGLAQYFDVADVSADPSLRFGVRLRRPGPEGIVITTYSAAETFFARPQARADGHAESANLFHPFWQARLASSEAAKPEAGAP